MGIIKKLDNQLIDKIAAGEVVERPASVVKELVENSIDANSDNIKIEIIESGMKLIKVSDNGKGMDEEDIMLSFQRHATSKIIDENDLFSISTLGFRGEALASIASVSKLNILSSTNDIGNEIIVEGGNFISKNKIGKAKGTTIIVSDLFYNTPARKKYLKSKSTELTHIIDIITRYALNNPQVSFKLIHNDKIILNSPKTNEHLNNIVSIYGKDIAKELVEVNFISNSIEVKGFISKPNYTKLNKDFQSIYINGRFVKNKLITDAVYQGYGNLLFHERNPIFILNVIIDVKEVDVNVHPSKIHIKLSHEEAIQYVIKNAIINSLEKHNLVPNIKKEEIQKVFDKNIIKEKKKNNQYKINYDNQKELNETNYSDLFEKKINEYNEQSIEEIETFKIHGQINKTYILVEDEDGLVIVDQHAAEERINFEKFMEQLENKNIIKQQLLNPIMIEVTPKEANIINSGKNILPNIGFEIEDFGNNSFMIRSAPAIFNVQQTKEILFDLIHEAEISKKKIDDLTYDKIASKSCRASIKAGDELTYSSMKNLIKKLNLCKNPYTCPHGRPTKIKFNINDLDKMFKRI